MSYILEALKKSQRDRELGQVPDLATELYTDSAETRSSVSPWIIGSVVIALIALLIALYGVFGHRLSRPQAPEVQAQNPVLKQPQPVDPVASEAKDQTEAAAQLQKSASPTEARVEPAPLVADLPKPARPVARAEKKVSVQAPEQEAPAIPAPAAPPYRQTEVEKIRQEYARMRAREKQQEQKPKATTAANKPSTKIAVPAKKAYPSAHGLPMDVLARMPPINIMLQSYSENPAERFVILNSVKLQQGQSTVDGLRVQEIHVDGLLLEFEGYQFFHPR
jgi:general secretion pathway protein B